MERKIILNYIQVFWILQNYNNNSDKCYLPDIIRQFENREIRACAGTGERIHLEVFTGMPFDRSSNALVAVFKYIQWII